MSEELKDALKLHREAVSIIAKALEELANPYKFKRTYSGDAAAIIARLAHANILLERVESTKAPVSRPACTELTVELTSESREP